MKFHPSRFWGKMEANIAMKTVHDEGVKTYELKFREKLIPLWWCEENFITTCVFPTSENLDVQNFNVRRLI